MQRFYYICRKNLRGVKGVRVVKGVRGVRGARKLTLIIAQHQLFPKGKIGGDEAIFVRYAVA